LVVFYPSLYVVLKNWNRKCFWTSVVYILWNGLYTFHWSQEWREKTRKCFSWELVLALGNVSLNHLHSLHSAGSSICESRDKILKRTNDYHIYTHSINVFV